MTNIKPNFAPQIQYLPGTQPALLATPAIGKNPLPPLAPNLASKKRKAPDDSFAPNGQQATPIGGTPKQKQTKNYAPKRQKPNSPNFELSYQSFLSRLAAVNRSEVAEYNFGKPDNLHDNPFAAHWHQLDRQHQHLKNQIQNFINQHPGTTPQNYVNAYTRHYNGYAQAGQAGHLETPYSLANRVNWLTNMLNKAHGPREPLSTPWDLLHSDDQHLLVRVGNFKTSNPGATDSDFINAYSKEYQAVSRVHPGTMMEPPVALTERLTWVTGLLEYLQRHHIPPRV